MRPKRLLPENSPSMARKSASSMALHTVLKLSLKSAGEEKHKGSRTDQCRLLLIQLGIELARVVGRLGCFAETNRQMNSGTLQKRPQSFRYKAGCMPMTVRECAILPGFCTFAKVRSLLCLVTSIPAESQTIVSSGGIFSGCSLTFSLPAVATSGH